MNLFPSSFPSFAKLQTTSRQLRKGEFPPEEKREERRAFSCPPPLSLRHCLSRQSLSPVYESAHPPYFPSLAFEVHVEKWEGDEIPRLSLFMKVDSRPTSQLLTSSQTSNFLDIFCQITVLQPRGTAGTKTAPPSSFVGRLFSRLSVKVLAQK